MSLRVPPRLIAAGIRHRAAIRAGWMLGGLILVEAAAVTADALSGATEPTWAMVPILVIVVTAAAFGIVVASPSWITALLFLAVGSAGIVAYVFTLAETGIDPQDVLAIASLGAVLTLIGPVSGGALGGAMWALAGVTLAQGSLLVACAMIGRDPIIDIRMLIIGLLYGASYLLLARSDRFQQRLSDLDPVDDIIEKEDADLREEVRAAIAVHETVLRDLALIAHGPLQLTEHQRSRLRRDLDELRAERGADAVPVPADSVLVDTADPDEGLSDFYAIITELQWRGLTIDVGGNSYFLDALDAENREALLGATRAALDNVLQHSGETRAEVFIDLGDDKLTVMVVDEGVGFDIGAIAKDRLGLRMAIVRRIEDLGGTVSVWTSQGAGTSVIMTLPVAAKGGLYA